MRRPPIDLRLYPRNRGTSMGLAHQYSAEYLRVLFAETSRVTQVFPHRKNE